MEAFSLLKYWRGGGGGTSSDTTSSTATATILTAVAQDHGDDGPFFDLEFALPDEVDDSEDALENPNANLSGSRNSEDHTEEEEEEEDDNIEESEREFKFTLSPSTNDRGDANLPLSPSDDLFVLNSTKPQFTASLLKSATKFRVFMSGLKKPKSNMATDSVAPNPKQQPDQSQKKHQERKLFTVKFKVEEVPIMSLFTRDNSSKGNNSHNQEESPSSSDDKRFSKEVIHKYLKKVKPLYVRVSRRYGDRLGFSGQLNLGSGGKAAPPHAAAEKKPSPAKADGVTETAGTNSKRNLQLQTGLRVVCKHLGKSRSAVAAAPLSSKRRDDSLLQQQDGIQGAILHCKRSFNASTSEGESSQLPRSVTDPLHEASSDEAKDKRL